MNTPLSGEGFPQRLQHAIGSKLRFLLPLDRVAASRKTLSLERRWRLLALSTPI